MTYKYAREPSRRRRYLIPTVEIILISRKAIDEKPIVGVLGSLHGAADEATGNLHGNDRAVSDMRLDEFAVLRAGLGAFLAQQITGRQVDITVALDDVTTQRALAGARAAQDEHHLRLPSRRDSGHRADTTTRTGHERSQRIHVQSRTRHDQSDSLHHVVAELAPFLKGAPIDEAVPR